MLYSPFGRGSGHSGQSVGSDDPLPVRVLAAFRFLRVRFPWREDDRAIHKGGTVRDAYKTSGSSPTSGPLVDFTLDNHGSIVLLHPHTNSARLWVHEHIGRDNGFQPYWPNAIVIEPRYVPDILEGIASDGLTIGGAQ